VGSHKAVRSDGQAGLPHELRSLVERELTRAHALAVDGDRSSPLRSIASFFASHIDDEAAA